ncbi:histidine phosphatase family protein [uncultured Sunxiuqinia sp.]|uniref:SixA phosphatase family protein n=1 Tax=uncultured Sunxiuqinia sp. TaxID=1573825 RepID=UPI002AA6C583|nr:histidine phosphatase family protein [uncultured Sunxiuqinia sp.]
MKRVVIVRHAKAVPYGYEDDFNRKLRDRGKKDANQISSTLMAEGKKADLIISSPAKRAFKTAKIYADNFHYPIDIIITINDLYHGLTTQEFLDLINDLSDDIQSVYIFGHNPMMHQMSYNLSKSFNSDMPTCSTVGIDFEVDKWSEVDARNGNVSFHLMPRMFS